ncbi:replication factor C subunit 2 [[Candida] anglica]|uniref:Replication factor C subunit 2 n=1 Tax=[Candida] anglica TaxID=148631 RepID=A0ABP0E914_9ASCO
MTTQGKVKNALYEEERLQHTPWVEKYRPKNLDDVASQDHAVKVLKKTLQSANLPHMLFYGPPGTGKTSTVLALSKQLYGPRLFKTRVLELNASDERGISIVRQKIKNFARLTVSNPSKEDLEEYPCPPYKIIILDEADSMTNDAQSALRRTMETYSGVTRFCLICNYITRIIDPLASRCSKFRFRLLDNEHALNRLEYVVQQENVKLANDKVLSVLLKLSNGDLRKAITYLQSATRLHELGNTDGDVVMEGSDDAPASGSTPITTQSIQEIAGVVPDDIVDQTIEAINSKDPQTIIKTTNETVLQGWSAQQLVDQLHDKFILNDTIDAAVKSKIAAILFSTDKKLNNGTDEHIQLLNLSLQLASTI